MESKNILQYERIVKEKNQSFRYLHLQETQECIYYWHYHPEYEIVYVVNGSGRQYVGEYRSFYDNGTLVMIGANQPHLNFSYGRKDGIEEIVVQIPISFIQDFCKNLPEAQNIIALFEHCARGLVFGKKTQAEIGEKLIELGKMEGINRVLALLTILNQLAESHDYEYLNLKSNNALLNSKEHQYLNNVIEYIENNFEKDIDIQQLAKICNMNLSTFCKFFKKHTNVTFTEFLNETRINQARILLSQGKQVSETAYLVGYNHLGYFSNVFKKYVGKSPKDFAKMGNVFLY